MWGLYLPQSKMRGVLREKVDVRRVMSENRAKETKQVERRPSQTKDVEQSELPYRQSSVRLDGFNKQAQTQLRPLANFSGPDSKSKAPATKGQAPPRPPLPDSKSAKPAPTPLLAKPPSPPIIPGEIIVTGPESDKGPVKTMSPYAIREAYLESALTLPIDMLSQVQRERPVSKTGGANLKPARSTSSIGSVMTTGRLASLLGQGQSKGPSPNGGNKQLAAGKADEVRQLGSNKTVGSKPNRMPPMGDIENLAPEEPVRQAKSNQSSRQVRKPSPVQEIPRSLGSAPALGRTTTIPTNKKSQIPSATQSTSKPSALGLDLGPPIPTSPNPQIRPAPHRQLSALRRPALTPGNSTDNLLASAALGTLGRRSRDPSMTDLGTRFEPATYPLPESKSSLATKSITHTEESVISPVKPVGGGGKKGKKGKKGPGGQGADVAGEQNAPADQPDVVQNQPKAAKNQSKAPKNQPNVTAEEPPVEISRQTTPVPAVVITNEDDSDTGRRSATPHRSKPRIIESTPPNLSLDMLEVPSPPPPDYIISPPYQADLSLPPRERHTLPRGISSRVAQDDRVSFEVPNGTRGRLRVSLAWVRDRATRSHTLTPSDAPPPLPPKSPPGRRAGQRREGVDRQQRDQQDVRRRPSPYPQQTPSASATSPPQSAGIDQAHQEQQAYIPLDPYFSQPDQRTYRPPPAAMSQYPLGAQFAYPQPQPQLRPGGPWASMPHLAQAQTQAQAQAQAQMQAMGARYIPHDQSAESFDPPSARNSPIPGYMSLPNVGASGVPIRMPLGMSMGHPMTQGQGQGRSQMGVGGMQGIDPYSNQSLGQNRQNQWPGQGPDREYGQDHQQDRYQDQGQRQGRNPYQQYANYGNNGNRQSIWKRMMNGNFNGNASGNKATGWKVNRNAQGQYEAYQGEGHDGYPNQNYQDQNPRPQGRWGWGGGNDKVGKWIRGITPGRAPPATQSNANANLLNRKDYSLAQPIFGRRARQYDGPTNDERPDDGDQRQRPGRMMNWFSSFQDGRQRNEDGNRLLSRNAKGNGLTMGYPNGYYSTNRPRNRNVYGEDPFRSDQYQERETRRREKAQRRSDRDKQRSDRIRRQIQAEAQGRKGQRKWKGRLPRNRRDQGRERRGGGRQDVYGQNGQSRQRQGLGLLGGLFG